MPLFLHETAELVCNSEPTERFPQVNARATLLLWVYGPRMALRHKLFAYGNVAIVGKEFTDGAPPELLALLFDGRRSSVAVKVEGRQASIARSIFDSWVDAHAYLANILDELAGVTAGFDIWMH